MKLPEVVKDKLDATRKWGRRHKGCLIAGAIGLGVIGGMMLNARASRSQTNTEVRV